MPRPTKRQKQARETFEKIAWRKIEKEHKEEIAANRKKLKRKNGKFVTKEEVCSTLLPYCLEGKLCRRRRCCCMIFVWWKPLRRRLLTTLHSTPTSA